ncbi:MAG: phosphate signaling complex protein PhoU [Chloroflexi bacterium]|nr:phosphate signaling complex protein PhoU [Chloroflexota bacterium]
MDHPTSHPADHPGGPDREVEEILARVEGDVAEPLRTVHRPSLDRGERSIRDTLLRMGSLIEERILLTVDALETHDGEKALAVIRGDEEINELHVEAQDLVVLTIATQAPVARDLRLLLALDRIGYELERIGDSIANVAKRARELAPEPPLDGHVGVPEMGRLAAQFLAETMRAFTDADAAAARSAAARDDAIDAIYHRALERLVILAKADPENVERAMRLLVAARYMERIGDHVTNIAEDVVFLSSGRHEDLNP